MKIFRATLVFFALASLLKAGVALTLQEVGADVVLSGSGTIDTTGLDSPGSASWSGSVKPSTGWAVVGASGGVTAYLISNPPGPIGPSATVSFADSNTGDVFGFNSSVVYVPFNYVSGSSLQGSSTFAGQSLASLGLTPGTYTWSWGSGPNADSATLAIGGAAIPEPSAVALLAGIAGLAFAGTLRLRGRHPRASDRSAN